MNKRHFLTSASVAAATGALSTLTAPVWAAPKPSGPVLLTVAGAITQHNRGPIDPAFDQMMVKHGVKFAYAQTFDAAALQRLPKVNIRPTLEYDNKVHTLTGPLLSTVLAAAGVNLKAALRIGLRALDGYNVNVNLADALAYRMIVATHMDGQALALGSLGPQWAVYEADTLAAFKDKPMKERFALCPWGVYCIDVAVI